MAAANVFELMASASADDNRELIAQMTDRPLLSDSCYVSRWMDRLRGATGKPSRPPEYSDNTQGSHPESELNMKAMSTGKVCENVLRLQRVCLPS